MANPESKQLAIDIIARVDKLEKGMARAKRAANDNYKAIENRTGSMVAKVNNQMAGIGKSFALGLGGGIAAALAPLALFDKAIREIGDAAGLQRLADRIGLGVEQLQALQYGAIQAGVNIDQMGDGLGDFAAKVAEAAAGAGPLAEIFKANNVQLKQADGTLRSTRDVLAEFANLIQNAATPAEQLFLAQQAFGDEAAKMVPLFKDGARGLEQLESNAKAAGAVVDAELIKRAEELDTRMQSMWATFSARSKSAILTAITAMDGLLAKVNEYEQRKAAADAGAMVGGLVKPKGEAMTFGQRDKPTTLDARMGGALATSLDAADQKLVDALKARYGTAAAKATVIPTSGGGSGGKGGGGGLRESVDYAAKLIEQLEHEKSLIGLSGVELEKANALWRAGKDATAAQKEEIAGLVSAIYAARSAHEDQLRAVEELRDTAKDFASTLVDGLLDGKDATEVLKSAVRQLAGQIAKSGIEKLFSGIGGGGGGSILGSLFGIPGFASGTRSAPGGLALVGERGPEIVNLPKGSQVTPNLQTAAALSRLAIPQIAQRGSTGSTYNMPITINAPGADAAALARVERSVQELGKNIPKMVDARTDARQSRRTRA